MAVTADDIKAFYRHYLGREPLQSGIDGWLAAADSGQTLVQIAAGISQSPEAAVYRTYQQTLGREPEMEERAAWVNQINATGSIQQAVDSIATSEEAQQNRSGMLTGARESNTTVQAKAVSNQPTTVYIPEGASGAEVRDFILNDPFLSGMFGWLVDGLASGQNLAVVRSINAALRAEIRGDRQQCNDEGNFYVTKGQRSVAAEDATDFIAMINPNSPAYERGQTWLKENNPEWKDLIDEHGQEAVTEASQAAQTILSKLPTTEQAGQAAIEIMKGVLSPSTIPGLKSDCAYSGNPTEWEWWRQCVNVGVWMQIPGLPELPQAVLGTIFSGATIGDIEDAIRSAGGDIQDIFDGTKTIGEVADQVTNSVLGKIEDLKTDILNGIGVAGGWTPEDILGKIGEVAGPIILGQVLTGAEDQISDILGLPVAVVSDDDDFGLCADGITKKADKDGTNCPTVGGEDDSDDSDLTDTTSEFGTCPDGITAKTDPEGTNCNDLVGQVECPDGTLVDNIEECGTTVTQIECPQGTDKAGQMVNDLSECSTTVTQIECPQNSDRPGEMVDDISECTTGDSGSTVVDDNIPVDTKCDGNDLTLLNASGQEVDRVPNHYECTGETTPPPPDPCEGEGSGKVLNPSTDQCECPQGTVEDAAGNCVTPTGTASPPEEEEEEEERSGGGGSGGGGMMTPFSIRPIGITAQPTLAARQEFPITNYLQGMLTGNGNKLA